MQTKTKSLQQVWFTPFEIPSFHNSSIAQKSRRIKKIESISKNFPSKLPKEINSSKQDSSTEQANCQALVLPRFLNPMPVMKTPLEIHFTFQPFNADYQLGQLGISPYSFQYRVARVDCKMPKNLVIISFEELVKEKISWDTLFRILQQQNNEDSNQACSNIITLKNMHEKMTFYHMNTMEDLEDVYSGNQPFQLTLYKVTTEGSYLYQLMVNQNLLMLMGVTYEMLLNHIKETQTIPEPIFRSNYFKTWNQLFEATINQEKIIPIELQTFEGARYSCNIMMQQFFIKGSDCCWFAELLAFQMNERLEQMLYNIDRINRNRISYYNLKDLNFQNEIQTIGFQEATQQRQPIKNKTPCGYKLKTG